MRPLTSLSILSSAFFQACLFSLFFLFTSDLHAKTYDVYVDDSYTDGDEDGTKDRPYQTLSKALEAVMENSPDDRSIYVASGGYAESIILGKKVKLVGESQKKVTLTGRVTLSDDTSISNLTVSGITSGVIIMADASAMIENCRVRDFGKIGIRAEKGGGTVTVKDSEIKGGSGKGFYIELGREISLIGNTITENREEGIDIRAQVDGVVKRNVITKNGESGIELLVGGSDLEIVDNKINGNKASGIATQFYEDFKEKGKISIVKNDITNNTKYGLDCAAPSGGERPTNYFVRSLDIRENVFLDNQKKSLAGSCKIILATDETEEAKDNVLEEETAMLDPSAESLPPAEIVENIFDETDVIVAEHEGVALNLETQVLVQEERSVLSWWWQGLLPTERESLLREQQKMHNTFFQIEDLEKTVQREENKIFLAETKSRLSERERGLNQRIERLEQRFSLGGWFRSLFRW